MVQISRTDSYKQRPIQREEVDISRHLREERFSFAEYPRPAAKYFGQGRGNNKFINTWLSKYPGVKDDERLVVKQAAKGIEVEGESCGEGFEAKIMSDQLMEVQNNFDDKIKAADNDKDRTSIKHRFIEEISKCCMQFYTAESFLYKLMNKTLRNEDMSKIDTLGAYCYLLGSYVYFSGPKTLSTVYRGCELTDDMLEA
ncbi:unnamed protein product, partial [Didymodactylos carnosus]